MQGPGNRAGHENGSNQSYQHGYSKNPEENTAKVINNQKEFRHRTQDHDCQLRLNSRHGQRLIIIDHLRLVSLPDRHAVNPR